ncbi:hypothetical protein [Streptomyces sp. NPDC058623]|uniref:hypothetical protein n=1 Tax=Streptomyces sp. NPDC058623 TaxID=3346563 RepID=UPI0036546C55
MTQNQEPTDHRPANHRQESRNGSAYVAALLERWCDITEDEGETSPWSVGPLIESASGPLIYFGMGWSRAEEASAYAADLADSMGLVCFDVRENQLRP